MSQTISSKAKRIFLLVKNHCENKGLLNKLDKHLENPEKHRFDADKTEKEGLYVLDAVHCVVDKKRTFHFLNEIFKQVKPKDRVLEAGIGTGILSLAASIKAKEVVGIEINRSTLELANEIKQEFGSKKDFKSAADKIEFHHGDATKFEHGNKFSVLISENIYTGMFYEKQVQISNSIRRLLDKKYIAIPEKMISFVSLAATKFPSAEYKDKELFVPLEHPDMKTQIISNKIEYSNLNFGKIIDENISFSGELIITKSAVANSIYITSDVLLPSGDVVIGKNTIFFNNDIIISFLPSIDVQKGDRMRITISYKAGDNPHDMILKIEKAV
jgi:predicted RNA methylase